MFSAEDESLLDGGDSFFFFDALFYPGDLLYHRTCELVVGGGVGGVRGLSWLEYFCDKVFRDIGSFWEIDLGVFSKG